MADLAIPEIQTILKPEGRYLLAARFEVQRNPRLAAAFEKYKGQSGEEATKALSDEIEPLLAEALDRDDTNGMTVTQLSAVCDYLAAEYLQIGDSVLIIDRETGKAIARVSDDDMWVPDPIPRESGAMVQRGPQLRPDIQGYLVKWKFDRARETRHLQTLTNRLVQTGHDRGSGDRRLLATTKAGRDSMVQELGQSLSGLLPGAVGGSLGAFVALLSTTGEIPTNLRPYQKLTAYARVKVGIQDGLTRNLSFDIQSMHKASIAAQWAREIAKSATHLVASARGTEIRDFSNPGFGVWVAPPDVAFAIRNARHNMTVVPVEGTILTLFTGALGHLEVGPTEIASRELHDRWEIVATLEYSLYLDFDNAIPVVMTGMPEVSHRAVVV